MLKRDVSQLAIYEIEKEVTFLPLTRLRALYLEKTSEIVYITKSDKLYGIVCLGDVLYHNCADGVRVNRTFTSLSEFNILKAQRIFGRAGTNISKIPVVDKEGQLMGDYSCWNDMLFIERNSDRLMKRRNVKNILGPYATVYVVEPVDNRNRYYLQLKEYLEQFEIDYTMLSKEQIGDKLSENAICIFLDEDERRGMQCLYQVEVIADDITKNSSWKIKFVTYKSLLRQIMWMLRFERLQIEKPLEWPYSRIDDKATFFLSALKEEGIRCFALYMEEVEISEYETEIKNKAAERMGKCPLRKETPWPLRAENEAFYGELYEQEDYRTELAQREIYEGALTFYCKKNISGKYFNAKDGRRITCNQPEEHVGTIYFFGPCMIVGGFTEDQYTIESFLQKSLLEKGIPYRVENCGVVLGPGTNIDVRLQDIEKYQTNDIVIYLSLREKTLGIPGCSLGKIFDKYKIPAEYFTDFYVHCNHKANYWMAESIYEMIESCVTDKNYGNEGIQVCFRDVMERYVRKHYLCQYFSDFSSDKYSTAGAIVMNCNPFSKGHRYLIEQAAKCVELLIIFVVEEDKSLFPFEERFKLVVEGTKDLGNVMVVPSGKFILSANNFPEYFVKQENEVFASNAEYDINTFADYIAGPLHITHRFVGSEPEDSVTRIYNETMKRILPQKGIAYVEIPRMTVEGEFVSASRVRKYLEEKDYEKALFMVPESTKQYLMKQI